MSLAVVMTQILLPRVGGGPPEQPAGTKGEQARDAQADGANDPVLPREPDRRAGREPHGLEPAHASATVVRHQPRTVSATHAIGRAGCQRDRAVCFA